MNVAYDRSIGWDIEAERSGRHFTEDIFKPIFLNETAGILIEIPLKCMPLGSNW